ncbi:BTB/POZ and MATH domain-containing protein 2-like [Panicum miliaceum]|uniref:BTB/POZ and MATH domain-containing protein 2-like n=1 Tax=Panicum miliaceum TaxID=4540 RepID=A0A3L6PAW7_PANMI|nr:BTB/POZ and MATH domain-containing protein 2-like [Panicum miliaceum]
MASSLPTTLRMLVVAWRGAREALSFSSTRLRQHTGAHLHRIDRYSAVDAVALAGQRVESAPFRLGGHEWQLHFYPRGVLATSDAAGAGRVSVDLMLRRARDPWWRLLPALREDVTAAYRVSILDGDGNRAFGAAVGPRRFRGSWSSAGAEDVATVEELRAALQRGGEGGGGDGIVVRCDVTVTSLEKESRIKWCIRQLVGKLSLDSIITSSQVDEISTSSFDNESI